MHKKVRLRTASPESNLFDAIGHLVYNQGRESIVSRELSGRRSCVSGSGVGSRLSVRPRDREGYDDTIRLLVRTSLASCDGGCYWYFVGVCPAVVAKSIMDIASYRWGSRRKSQSLMKLEAVLWYDGCVNEEFLDGKLKEAPA